MAATYIARSSEIAARMIGGEMMIMSSIDSTFYTLNEVATAIWQAAECKTPLARNLMSPATRPARIPNASSKNSHSTASFSFPTSPSNLPRGGSLLDDSR